MVSVVVNVLVLPMVPVAMLLTFITGMLGFISTTLALPFAYLTYISLAYILGVAERFASLPFASYVVPAFPFWIVVVSYAGMGFILWRLWNRGGNPTKHDGPTPVNVNKEESDELEGWIIEEDNDMKSTQLSVGTETEEGKDEPTDTPIFFK